MTTKLKARKFRIRRASPLAGASLQPPGTAPDPAPAPPFEIPPDAQLERATDGFGETPFPGSTAAEAQSDTTIDTARGAAEDELTGRQLRMARRLAQKHGLPASSDMDAVHKLRAAGIDPFERANMLELVVPDIAKTPVGGEQPAKVQLPQTVDPTPAPAPAAVPATEVEERRDVERTGRNDQIRSIQRDIARRRRRRLVLLCARLTFFVFLPTFLAGWYYYNIATPMYATKTEFVIQKSEGAAAGGGLGGLFTGTQFATTQDSIAVQSYLTSRDAMLRLDEDAGFRTHFSQPHIDPIQRLPEDATRERTYDLYKNKVTIGYDPTEGIIKMEVVATDPDVSAEYSRRLIDYAEEEVDALTHRMRGDQMSGARASYDEAEANMLAAQNRVLELQEQLGVLDPIAESGAVMAQIATFETQLNQKRLELRQLLSNLEPNEARVAGVRGDISRLQGLVAGLRGQMTNGSGDAASLARVSAQLRLAETELTTRTALMQQSLQQLETARIEANRQTRYLSLGVTPVPPDEATYPRAFENTLLAFLIFAGLYLLLSLTASILREQVSG